MSNRQQLQRQSPSDIPADRGGPSSNLKGGLPRRKYKTSPFDRIGARQWESKKGQMDTEYA